MRRAGEGAHEVPGSAVAVSVDGSPVARDTVLEAFGELITASRIHRTSAFRQRPVQHDVVAVPFSGRFANETSEVVARSVLPFKFHPVAFASAINGLDSGDVGFAFDEAFHVMLEERKLGHTFVDTVEFHVVVLDASVEDNTVLEGGLRQEGT